MNITVQKPELSETELAERAKRQKISDMARASNVRQGYVHDPILEAAKARYVAGEISLDEMGEQMLARFRPS